METGLESLREAVMADCQAHGGEFNSGGCNAAGQKCTSKSHKYCDKYRWTVDRAAAYAALIGKTTEEVLRVWEGKRGYWYMNYYQECNQPAIDSLQGTKVIMYEDWITQLKKRFGDDSRQWRFVCPSCGHVQKIQDFIDREIAEGEKFVYYNCIGRYVTGIGCNWTLGGLLKINKSVVIRDMIIIPVFEMEETAPTT